MMNFLSVLIIGAAWMLSFMLAGLPMLGAAEKSLALKALALGSAPLIFIAVFPLVLGLVSRPFQKGIVPGKFPRILSDKVYFCRRVYGLCWTQLFYFKPLYSIVLTVPFFRKMVLGLFGYKGSNDFTLYPDTWVRDLPLLKVSKGVYLANRATLGTNLVLTDGSILVGGITLGEKALVGHLCIVGTGVRLGKEVEIGMRTSLGIRVDIKEKGNIKPHCAINHGTVIGEGASVGTMSFVGTKCVIGSGIHVPSGASIPDGAILNEQADCERYFSSESIALNTFRESIIDQLRNS